MELPEWIEILGNPPGVQRWGNSRVDQQIIVKENDVATLYDDGKPVRQLTDREIAALPGVR